jgi:hypothetical protein
MSREQRAKHAERRERQLCFDSLFCASADPYCDHGVLYELACPICGEETEAEREMDLHQLFTNAVTGERDEKLTICTDDD